MRKQQEIAPLRADFNCFREQPSPGLTHTGCDMLAEPHLLSGSADGRHRGTQSRVPVQRQAMTQHTQGLALPEPCPALFATEGEKAQHHSLLQGWLCSHRHRGDAGRAALQLPPVTHLPSGEALAAKERDPGNHKPKLTCLLWKALFTQEKQWSETFKKHISQVRLILVKICTEIQF